jgi:hypothetical protein
VFLEAPRDSACAPRLSVSSVAALPVVWSVGVRLTRWRESDFPARRGLDTGPQNFLGLGNLAALPVSTWSYVHQPCASPRSSSGGTRLRDWTTRGSLLVRCGRIRPWMEANETNGICQEASRLSSIQSRALRRDSLLFAQRVIGTFKDPHIWLPRRHPREDRLLIGERPISPDGLHCANTAAIPFRNFVAPPFAG